MTPPIGRTAEAPNRDEAGGRKPSSTSLSRVSPLLREPDSLDRVKKLAGKQLARYLPTAPKFTADLTVGRQQAMRATVVSIIVQNISALTMPTTS